MLDFLLDFGYQPIWLQVSVSFLWYLCLFVAHSSNTWKNTFSNLLPSTQKNLAGISVMQLHLFVSPQHLSFCLSDLLYSLLDTSVASTSLQSSICLQVSGCSHSHSWTLSCKEPILTISQLHRHHLPRRPLQSNRFLWDKMNTSNLLALPE